MSWFCRKQQEKPVASDYEIKIQVENDRRAILEQQAKDQTAEVLSKWEEISKLSHEEHEKDSASYTFKCERNGSFLCIYITRPNNATPRGWGEPDTEYATALNLSNITSIRLLAGHPPDCEGAVHFHRVTYYENETKNGARPILPEVPKHRAMWSTDKPTQTSGSSSGIWFGSSYEHRIEYKVAPYPRPASDDAIRLEGVATTLYMPAGRGQAILQQILAATDGWVRAREDGK